MKLQYAARVHFLVETKIHFEADFQVQGEIERLGKEIEEQIRKQTGLATKFIGCSESVGSNVTSGEGSRGDGE